MQDMEIKRKVKEERTGQEKEQLREIRRKGGMQERKAKTGTHDKNGRTKERNEGKTRW